MSRRERLARTIAIVLTVVFLLVLLVTGALWLRAEFSRQSGRQVHHSLRLVCRLNTSYCLGRYQPHGF